MSTNLESALTVVKETRAAYNALLDVIEDIATKEGIDGEQRATLILIALATKAQPLITKYAEAVIDLAGVES